MALNYRPIYWNAFKVRYDQTLALGILFFLVVYLVLNKLLYPQLILPTIIIRSFGWLSILLLHIILSIGPLCRLNNKFHPLLYNRRHLGVTMFLAASVHAILSLIWFHGNGNVHPLISLFTSNIHYGSLVFFPFQVLGFLAYVILMLMAFTSHDFWLKILTPALWKKLHMLVYFAYLLLMMHVVLGILQLENHAVGFIFLFAGTIWISILHLLAGRQEWLKDKQKIDDEKNQWLYAGDVMEIPLNRAKVVIVGGERVAIYRYENRLSAVHNVCKHQLGPLGEGHIVEGCITCPWHGYQYLPHNGCSPAPFKEKVATYELQLRGQKIFINPLAKAEGTEIPPLTFVFPLENKIIPEYFIGWQNSLPKSYLKAIRSFVFPAFTLSLFFGIVFTITQKHLANSSFDYNHPLTLAGAVNIYPFPHLRYIQGKDIYGNPTYALIPLVNTNKFGADEILQTWCARQKGEPCQGVITGGILQRDDRRAMELSGGITSLDIKTDLSVPTGAIVKLSDTVLMGEIVDPKCYLGAMNPGEGKPHRSCAIRCISGGIMPVLVWKIDQNKKEYAVLTGEKGKPINQEVLFALGEPVKISGKLYQIDNWYWFEIKITDIIRLTGL